MPSSQSGSSKRRQSDSKKLARARSRAAAAARRERNGRTQEKQHQYNLQHQPTPWQQACTEREFRRLITCGTHRVVFEIKDEDNKSRPASAQDGGMCPVCGGTANLRDTWTKRHGAKKEQLSAA